MKFSQHVNFMNFVIPKKSWNLSDVNNECHEHNLTWNFSDTHYVHNQEGVYCHWNVYKSHFLLSWWIFSVNGCCGQLTHIQAWTACGTRGMIYGQVFAYKSNSQQLPVPRSVVSPVSGLQKSLRCPVSCLQESLRWKPVRKSCLVKLVEIVRTAWFFLILTLLFLW